jgi:hypothetical protein
MSEHAQRRSGAVVRLRPLRVLLAGRDSRFLRVTSFLLLRRGYDVAQTDTRGVILMAERHLADVVLIETRGSWGSTGRTVSVLQTLAAPPGVVLICDNGDKAYPAGFTAVRKWAPLEELVEEIEAASVRRPSPLANTDAR